MPVRIMVVALILCFGWVSALAMSNSKRPILTSGESSAACGFSITLPPELTFDGKGQLQDCLGSYKSNGGTVLSLAPLGLGNHDSSWIDRIPSFHIQNVGIDRIIRTKNSLILINGNGIESAKQAPSQCGIKAKELITKIHGENWSGWLIEDIYGISSIRKSIPDSCVQYSAANRCIRMLIGNSKSSVTMQQYCVTRNPQEFDLDNGLSYDIFLKVVKSIHFNED
jgi:hypothetical protein